MIVYPKELSGWFRIALLLFALLPVTISVSCSSGSDRSDGLRETDAFVAAVDFRSMVMIGGATARWTLPLIQTEIEPFLMDRFEVTVGEFRAFVEETGYRPAYEPCRGYWLELFEDEALVSHPMTYVSFADAQAYATSVGKRLPTEAEWMRASAGRKGFTFPWGGLFHANRCNTFELFLQGTTNVGTFESGQSEDGCYDLCGNVWEWTTTSKTDISPGVGDRDRTYLIQGRIVKGGSFRSVENRAKCHYRLIEEEGNYSVELGFRCVKKVTAEVILQLRTFLSSPRSRLRIDAAGLYAKLPVSVAADPLAEALDGEEDPGVVEALVDALKQIRQDGDGQEWRLMDEILDRYGLRDRHGLDLLPDPGDLGPDWDADSEGVGEASGHVTDFFSLSEEPMDPNDSNGLVDPVDPNGGR